MGIDFSAFVAEWVVPVAKALGIVAAGFWFSRIAGKLALRQARNARLSEVLARFLGQATRYVVIAAAVLSAASAVNIDATSVVALLGSAGIAVGLALQGTLSHFASGVMLLIFRPFEIDDVVTAGGHTGRVEEIGLFATTLVTPENHTIIIPNGAVASGSIINITRRGYRRETVTVGVSYGSNVDEVKAILQKAAESVEQVRKEPGVAVGFTGLGASSIDFTVAFFADVPDVLAATGGVRKAVYEALNENGIDIPYNIISVQQVQA